MSTTQVDLDIVPTRAMRLQAAAQSSIKATVFESHRSKKSALASNLKIRPGGTSTTANASDSGNPEFDLKRAKHEILNFGISGFDSKDKHAAKLALAIRLGARPPKNEYTNYKDLLAEKKKQQAEAAEQSAFRQIGKNAQGAASVTYKKLHSARRKKKLQGQIDRHYGVVNPKIHKKKK